MPSRVASMRIYDSRYDQLKLVNSTQISLLKQIIPQFELLRSYAECWVVSGYLHSDGAMFHHQNIHGYI